jgi:hypothetical protein|tara:strand:+ start:45499 stop:45795 length:297 start_codon:yes stop_codon:yes gene_type:complete
MIIANVEIDYIKFLRSSRTIIKILLKTNLKAYTIFDLEIDELDQTYKFRKSIKKNGFRINGKKLWTGSYKYTPDEEEKNMELILYIDTKKDNEEDGTN